MVIQHYMLANHNITLNIVFIITNGYLSCPLLIVKRPCGVTNAKCKSNTVCHSLKKKDIWALYNHNIANTITYKWVWI